MKKCQDCRANHENNFCSLEYKTEKLTEVVRGFLYEYISPLEKCIKPKNKKEFIKRSIQIRKNNNLP